MKSPAAAHACYNCNPAHPCRRSSIQQLHAAHSCSRSGIIARCHGQEGSPSCGGPRRDTY
eukprot:scaffold127526_cov19-Tisochrysis_lutea.AAC.1